MLFYLRCHHGKHRSLIAEALTMERNMSDHVSAVGDFISFLWANKKWWLAPMVGGLFIVGVVIILTNSSAIVPWVFSLF